MERGLPVTALLLFTVLIWILYGLILVSSPKNKVNQWCFICGYLLSTGILKEYLYYGGFLKGITVHFWKLEYEADELMNSVLTAVPYYLAMPCGVICSFYFNRLNRKIPRGFPFLCAVVFLPVLIFGAVYPWTQTRSIPDTMPQAYTIVAVYNLSYGVLMTALIIRALLKERGSFLFRQRRLVSVLGLLPLWYWLITIFLFRLLGLKHLNKAWQGNAMIICGLLIYYLYHLFHNGIWGMRLSREHFDWSDEAPPAPRDNDYISHMLKNEMSKIRLSVQLIRETGHEDIKEELNIIERSVSHIEEYVRRSNKYTGEILMEPENVDICALIRETAEEQTAAWKGKVEYDLDERFPVLFCDPSHMKEVLGNLISNALDAMGEDGILTLSYKASKKDVALICVADTGCGIRESEQERIFDLYYTCHAGYPHFGIGLSYCQNVIRAHKGYINIKSSTDPLQHGTEFTLCLPRGFRKEGKKGGFSDKSSDR